VRAAIAFAAVILSAAPAAKTPTPTPPRHAFRPVDRTLGPFQVDDRSFTVVVHEEHDTSASGPTDRTAIGYEVRDSAGRVAYASSSGSSGTFTPSLTEFGGLESGDAVTAAPLVGAHGSGLLIATDSWPSTPTTGTYWEVLGWVGGKLVRFGDVGPASDLDGKPVHTREISGVPGDVLSLSVWSGNLYVEVPVRVDWSAAKLVPAKRCETRLCEYAFEANRQPFDESAPDRASLFPAPDPTGPPKTVPIRKDSKIDYLDLEAEVRWSGSGGLSIPDPPWLEVRVDGVTGWTRDYWAVGLPDAD